MLSESEAAAMEVWVLAAERWSEASQALVGAAAGLALVSRTLGDQLHGDGAAFPEAARRARSSLADELAALAEAVEDETRTLRDAYLETAARIESYKNVLG